MRINIRKGLHETSLPIRVRSGKIHQLFCPSSDVYSCLYSVVNKSRRYFPYVQCYPKKKLINESQRSLYNCAVLPITHDAYSVIAVFPPSQTAASHSRDVLDLPQSSFLYLQCYQHSRLLYSVTSNCSHKQPKMSHHIFIL